MRLNWVLICILGTLELDNFVWNFSPSGICSVRWWRSNWTGTNLRRIRPSRWRIMWRPFWMQRSNLFGQRAGCNLGEQEHGQEGTLCLGYALKIAVVSIMLKWSRSGPVYAALSFTEEEKQVVNPVINSSWLSILLSDSQGYFRHSVANSVLMVGNRSSIVVGVKILHFFCCWGSI